MEADLVKDLIIAILGAVVGSVLVYFVSTGLQWTSKSRDVRRAQRDAEEADWRSGDPVKRQKLFNAYLFSVLKLFIIGSILIGVATAASTIEPYKPNEIGQLDYINFVADGIGVCFYVATLATILRFTRLVRQHP